MDIISTEYKRELINDLLNGSDSLTDQIFTLLELKMNSCKGKKELLMFTGMTEQETRKVDSAYPQQYADKIREIYPNFNKGSYCYSYINQTIFGELINVNNLIANKILEPIKYN